MPSGLSTPDTTQLDMVTSKDKSVEDVIQKARDANPNEETDEHTRSLLQRLGDSIKELKQSLMMSKSNSNSTALTPMQEDRDRTTIARQIRNTLQELTDYFSAKFNRDSSMNSTAVAGTNPAQPSMKARASNMSNWVMQDLKSKMGEFTEAAKTLPEEFRDIEQQAMTSWRGLLDRWGASSSAAAPSDGSNISISAPMPAPSQPAMPPTDSMPVA